LISDIQQVIAQRETDQGPCGTTIWLKSLKVDYVRHLAGMEPVGVYAKKNVRINGKNYRLPKGPFGRVFELGLRDKRRKVAHQVWQCLLAYTRYRYKSGEVSFAQWKKFSTAVRKEPPSKSQLREAQVHVSAGLATLARFPRVLGVPRPIVSFQPREGKNVPLLNRRTEPERTGLLRQVQQFFTYNRIPEEVAPLLEAVVKGTDMVRGKKWLTHKGGLVPFGYVGNIGLLQEPGLKLRAVANPNRVLQLALEPLGRSLFKWLATLPEDCCFHQETGVRDAQGWLAQGRKVYSFDLSNATDVIPLSQLIGICRAVKVPEAHWMLLYLAATGTWLVPLKSSVRESVQLRWKRGTPLGLYPCFALFSIWHHCLVRGICVSVGALDFPYRILGDDIVIASPEVAEEYQRVMGELGVSISMDKSVESANVAEFAGRVITRGAILHGLKYGDDTLDNSFLEQVKNCGPRVIRFLLPKQRHVAKWLSYAAPPVGFGFNPEGISYGVRLARAMAWELSAPRKSSADMVVQIQTVFSNWYSHENRELLYGRFGANLGRLTLDPDVIDQMAPRASYLGVPLQAFAGNLDQVLEFQTLEEALKGSAGRLMRLIRDLRPDVIDHPFNKPLIQSLYPRLLRAKELYPSCLVWVYNNTPYPIGSDVDTSP
jgi:hypothetical protein